MRSRPEVVEARIQNTVVPWFRCPAPGSDRRKDLRRSGTSGHLDPEEPDWPEGQDEDEDREDQGLAPLSAEERPAEDVDDADEEPADAGADDVADATEDRRGERDDAEVKADVPFEIAVLDAVDHRGGGGKRGADEEGRRDRAIDVDAA